LRYDARLSSAIDTVITAETPEGIEISIRPAGFAVRAAAFLIDASIRTAILVACGTALGAGGRFGDGIYLLVLFVINWIYPIIFEMTGAAATPGKRIMGLHVLMTSGLPLTPAGCLIRNLLRVVDMLPLLYAFAIVSILLRRDSRRLGDLAAGTVVAYRRHVPLEGTALEFESANEVRWSELEDLVRLAERRLEPGRFLFLYRTCCEHLAMARSRGFPAPVVARLAAVTARAHQIVYRQTDLGFARIARTLMRVFPAMVRAPPSSCSYPRSRSAWP